MKRQLIIAVLALLSTTVYAQEVQLHYDLGRDLYNSLTERPKVTTTVQMFKPDRFGSTFLFVDVDYYSKGAAGVYWEISRELTVFKNKHWALHVEYNGGVTSNRITYQSTRIQHALLAGIAWNWSSKDFTKNFSVQAMYKQYFNGQYRNGFAGFQTTAVWSDTFAKGLCTFTGFLDIWYDKDVKGKLIILSEPQFWFNFNALKGMKGFNLSVGTEVEISNNFVFNNRGENNSCYVIPTLAVKWTF